MTLCDVIFIAGGEHTSRLPHFSESIVLKHFEAAIGRGCAHGIGDLSFKCNVSKFLCFFVGFLAGKGWRGEWKALCLSFSGQTVSEPGQTYRQFQKFLLVIDSFGPNRCRKYVLKIMMVMVMMVIYQLTHAPESPLYWRHNASRWYFSTLLEKCWLYNSIDSFEDFLVDQDRQFQNTPNSRVDSFRFFWTYIHPRGRL